jgi:WD40-like Beta Propeller Repeat
VTGSRKDLRRLALAASFALACDHTDPFSTPPYGTTQPFDPTPPVQLTLNAGADRYASWLPDGSGIVYSSEQPGRADRDVCLAQLPPGGGSQVRLVCDLSALGGDTNNVIASPAVAPDGRLAFLKASGPVGAVSPDRSALTVAPTLDAANASDVQVIPYFPPGEPPRRDVQALRWLAADRLVYVACLNMVRRPCQFCPLDTITSGLKLDVLDLSQPGTLPAPVPGTDFASGVSVGGSSDEVYLTLAGDPRVYRRVLSTGETVVAHDFGAAGIARDVQVAGGRMTAIVGGRVTFSVDPELGPVQWDSGGVIHLVDLATGGDVALDPGDRLFRRPALAPAGDRLVAEGYQLIITQVGENPPDTTVSRGSDLFLFTTP